MTQTLANAFEWHDFESTETLPGQEQTKEIFSHLTTGAITYPNLAHAHLHAIINENRYDIEAVSRINQLMEKLLEQLLQKMPAQAGVSPEAYETGLRMSITQIAAASFFLAAIAPELFKPFLKMDLRDPGQQELYLNHLTEHLLT